MWRYSANQNSEFFATWVGQTGERQEEKQKESFKQEWTDLDILYSSNPQRLISETVEIIKSGIKN